MINRNHPLPINQQAKAVGISRGSVYYLPRPVSDYNQELMKRIDHLHLDLPFAGSRMLRDLLKQEGYRVGRKHVATLMKRMGIEALYRKPRTTKPGAGHKIYPYLLRNLKIDRPNQAWAMDITYIKIGNGFGYLTAVIDWYSRYVLSWRLSNTLENTFCIEAMEEALDIAIPEIFNTDQGSQYTATNFLAPLIAKDIKISMDSKGRALDNIFVLCRFPGNAEVSAKQL